jgi:hypothetical protein
VAIPRSLTEITLELILSVQVRDLSLPRETGDHFPNPFFNVKAKREKRRCGRGSPTHERSMKPVPVRLGKGGDGGDPKGDSR